jgi:opacity protein-like surface antigen
MRPIPVARLAILALILPLLGSGPASATGVGVRGALVNNTTTDENVRMVGAFGRLGGVFAVEGAIDYRNEDAGLGTEVRTWPVTASLLFQPIPFLYGLAGVGWYNTTVEFPEFTGLDEETTTEFGYHAGVGTQLPIVPMISLVGDVRYNYVDYDFSEFADAVGDFEDGNYVSLNVGLMFTPVGL